MKKLHSVVFLIGLLSLACGRNNPKYSEEIIGREEVHIDDQGQTTMGTGDDKRNITKDAPAPIAGGGLDCDSTFPPPAKGKATGTLQCGGSVQASNEGGSSAWGDDFYQQAFCTTARKHYDDSPEAIYILDVPANTKATVKLDSPCADLDLVAVAWALDGLPTTAQSSRVRECDMDTKDGGGKLDLTAVNKTQRFLIAVDGKEGDAGPFGLEVSCGTYR